MFGMFSYCQSLNSLDLSNFNTSKVDSFDGMFEDCSSLISLDLSNFKILVNDHMSMIDSMFDHCSSLEYINLENSIIKIEEDYVERYSEYMFRRINENILICSNDYKWNEIFKGSNITINCNNYKEYHCFKKNIDKPYYKYICKTCGKHYYQINNDTNINNSYIYCNSTQPESYNLIIYDSINNDIQTDIIIQTELNKNTYYQNTYCNNQSDNIMQTELISNTYYHNTYNNNNNQSDNIMQIELITNTYYNNTYINNQSKKIMLTDLITNNG